MDPFVLVEVVIRFVLVEIVIPEWIPSCLLRLSFASCLLRLSFASCLLRLSFRNGSFRVCGDDHSTLFELLEQIDNHEINANIHVRFTNSLAEACKFTRTCREVFDPSLQ